MKAISFTKIHKTLQLVLKNWPFSFISKTLPIHDYILMKLKSYRDDDIKKLLFLLINFSNEPCIF